MCIAQVLGATEDPNTAKPTKQVMLTKPKLKLRNGGKTIAKGAWSNEIRVRLPSVQQYFSSADH